MRPSSTVLNCEGSIVYTADIGEQAFSTDKNEVLRDSSILNTESPRRSYF
jgi:hypothetical protein